MNDPLISVILPVFNGAHFLGEAIQSVLDQKYDPLEIIVVDDGSTDNTQQVALNFGEKIIYARKENGGVSSARNLGLKLAKGEFISFIDSDDLWLNNKLLLQHLPFSKNPEFEITQGLTRRFLSPGIKPPINFIKDVDEQPTLTLHLGAGLFKKSVFDKIGLFDETMKFSEDIDWFLRAIESGIKISVLEETVYLYRIHESNMTLDVKNTNMYLLKAFKKSLDRRRQLNPENPLPLPDIKNPESLKSFLNKNHYSQNLKPGNTNN